MSKLLEFIQRLVAGLLLLVVVAGLPGVKSESSFQVAYAVLVIYGLFLGVTLRYFLGQPENPSRTRYVVISALGGVTSCLTFGFITTASNLTDSSHGGSVWIVVAGSLAFALVGLIFVSRKKRTS